MKSPEMGGQGGSSSQSLKTLTPKTIKELDALIAEGKLDGWSKEAMEIRQKLIREGAKE